MEYLRNCDQNPDLPHITQCINGYLDQQFPNCSTEMANLQGDATCSLTDLRARLDLAIDLKQNGIDEVKNGTGCDLPCSRHAFPMTLTSVGTSSMANIISGATEIRLKRVR